MAAERQHYVPKFLLKNFASGKKRQIHVYDKSNDKQFRTSIRNVAAEKGFYDLDVEEDVLTLEPSLAKIEGRSAAVVKKIVKHQELRRLNPDEIGVLAVFVAIQFVRTKEHRLRYDHIGELIAQKLAEKGATTADITRLVGTGPNDGKILGLEAVARVTELVPHFLNKAWALFRTDSRVPFYISDDPVTLHNQLDHGPYGNLGLAVRGIEIYLPVSSTLSLGLLCPSIGGEFAKASENMAMLDGMGPELADSLLNDPASTRTFCKGLKEGTAIDVVEDNVTMMNSLQVAYSSRFVYCEHDSFDLVKRMISDNEKYRSALRPTVG